MIRINFLLGLRAMPELVHIAQVISIIGSLVALIYQLVRAWRALVRVWRALWR